ncbi:transcriptional repressor [uncultured Variovorax sp.]|uniref:transcriptional repressor n=1 Tax=uncultured Variovorax sp. TaxID=114708 RepID=UPI0025CC8B4E|nr:transcriptional repressor [uncultured Variovorax sp.]
MAVSAAMQYAAAPASESFSVQLRSMGIRPTVIRLCVLQTLAESGSEWLGGEEVFRRMLARGTATGLASVYRVIKELEKADLIQREWERSLGGVRAVHRLRRPQATEGTVRLSCGGCNASVEVIDEALHRGLMRAAQAHGLSACGPVTVHLGCMKSDCARFDDALPAATSMQRERTDAARAASVKLHVR